MSERAGRLAAIRERLETTDAFGFRHFARRADIAWLLSEVERLEGEWEECKRWRAFDAARRVDLENALRPFANYACDPPCEGPCHNCIARTSLNDTVAHREES